jgi:hypothetical protein
MVFEITETLFDRVSVSIPMYRVRSLFLCSVSVMECGLRALAVTRGYIPIISCQAIAGAFPRKQLLGPSIHQGLAPPILQNPDI